jgi:hypothetical protein
MDRARESNYFIKSLGWRNWTSAIGRFKDTVLTTMRASSHEKTMQFNPTAAGI